MSKPNEPQPSKHTEKAIKHIEEDDQLHKEAVEDLSTNKMYQSFFAPYNTRSVEHFIKMTANHKTRLYLSLIHI